MKKIIQIEIEYPEFYELDIQPSDLTDIRHETMNQLEIVEKVFKGVIKIDVKEL